MKRLALAALTSAFLMLIASAAAARSSAAWGWELATVWPAAIRFLRVDKQFPIREKDEKAGYVVFDYLESGRSYRGTFEVVGASPDDPRGGTRVFVSLPALSKRYEAALLEALGRKLREESGDPPPHKPPPPSPNASPPTAPAPNAPQAGADAGLPQLPRPPIMTP